MAERARREALATRRAKLALGTRITRQLARSTVRTRAFREVPA
jgi:hypothetical protein